MEFKVCNKCGAQFMEGQLYWKTGAAGKKEDLSGLVCDKLGNEECLNELKGTQHSGQTWEKRLAYLEGATDEFKRRQKDLDDLIN